MSTVPKSELRENGGGSLVKAWWYIKQQPGGHKCPPYVDVRLNTSDPVDINVHPTLMQG